MAERFALGDSAALEGPVARGQLGQVWLLRTACAQFAVKEWFASPDQEATAVDAEFSQRVLAAGVCTPRVVSTTDGHVTATVDGTPVRVFEWLDLRSRTRRLDPACVGETVALLHRTGRPTSAPVDRWFSTGFGPVAWYGLLERLVDEGAPFAFDFAPLVGPLVEAELVMQPHTNTVMCHRDLWADNVLGTSDNRVCIIDFENAGPADPSQELAMVLFEFMDGEAERARTLYSAYITAGGPGRVTTPGHFTMLLATQAHIAHLAASKWVGERDEHERCRLEAWFREMLDDPVTLPKIEDILSALH